MVNFSPLDVKHVENTFFLGNTKLFDGKNTSCFHFHVAAVGRILFFKSYRPAFDFCWHLRGGRGKTCIRKGRAARQELWSKRGASFLWPPKETMLKHRQMIQYSNFKWWQRHNHRMLYTISPAALHETFKAEYNGVLPRTPQVRHKSEIYTLIETTSIPTLFICEWHPPPPGKYKALKPIRKDFYCSSVDRARHQYLQPYGWVTFPWYWYLKP